MTTKLTQDPLENMFSIMRQKNGYNKNPTARTFRCCFSAICSYSLMKCSESSNCEEDGDEFFNVETLNDVQINKPPYSEEIQEENLSDEYNLIGDCDTDSSSDSIVINTTNNKTSLENCAVSYFAGYLAYKCLNNFNCEECKKNLITSIDLTDKSQLLLTYKTFNVNEQSTQGLKAPSNILVKITNTCLNIFKEEFEKIKHEKQIVFKLLEISKRKINKHIFKLNVSPCKLHYVYILELLFRTRIFKECKWTNTELHNKAVQQISKLKVFKH